MNDPAVIWTIAVMLLAIIGGAWLGSKLGGGR